MRDWAFVISAWPSKNLPIDARLGDTGPDFVSISPAEDKKGVLIFHVSLRLAVVD